ncbi:MAG TPA: hypothetical protein VF026_12655 [Ktedonobacteraceae bacterium]
MGQSQMKPVPFIKQFQEPGLPVRHFQRVQAMLALLPCLVGGLLHLQVQLFQVGRPARSLFFCQKHQLAQQMHEAGGVPAVVQDV